MTTPTGAPSAPWSAHERWLRSMLEDDHLGWAGAMTQLADDFRRTDVLRVIGAARGFLAPAVLGPQEVGMLGADLGPLLDLLACLPDRLFEGDVAAMCDAVGIGGVAQAAAVRTWDHGGQLLARADLFRDATGFKLVEYNVHSRMGGLENAALARAMLRVPLVRQAATAEGLGFVDTLDGLADSLRRLVPGDGDCAGVPPVVAVLDWPTAFPSAVAGRMSALLCERGFDAFAGHVGQAHASGSGLDVAGRHVDLVYRAFLVDDLVAGEPGLEAILDQVERGATRLVMGFGAELIGSKGALALLSDPSNARAFSAEEQTLVRRYVPWTRLLRRGSTIWRGREVDVPELAVRAQRDLVLKPSVGRGGQGVLAGWVTSSADWRTAVDRAIDGPVRYVLQERVLPVADRLPWMSTERIAIDDFVLNWGVFVVDGQFCGCLVRGSTLTSHPVIGVGTGAAVGCCLHPPLPRGT